MTAATSTRRHGVAIVAAVALLAACGDPTGTTVRVDLQTVSAGATHTCALARDGSAYCWGDNEDGQSGAGSTNDSPVPARVSGGHVFTALTTGGLHTCGLVDVDRADAQAPELIFAPAIRDAVDQPAGMQASRIAGAKM